MQIPRIKTQTIYKIWQNMIKFLQFFLFIYFAFIGNCTTTQQKIDDTLGHITKGPHAILSFYIPESFDESLGSTSSNLNWDIKLELDGSDYVNGYFTTQREEYRVPITPGKHRIRLKMFTEKPRFFRGDLLYGYFDTAAILPVYGEKVHEIDVKPGQIYKITMFEDEDRSGFFTFGLQIFNNLVAGIITAPLSWPLGLWPAYNQQHDIHIDLVEKNAVAKEIQPSPKEPVIIEKNIPVAGKVFSVKNDVLELTRESSENIRSGNIVVIYNKTQKVASARIAQAFHTKFKAVVISKANEIAKGMEYKKLK
jgi:hypothetical protein